MAQTLYAFDAATMHGTPQPLKDYDGQVILIVNTASKCGLTPQFKTLEAMYEKYKDQGFTVLGFPCNQFAGQDPGNNDEILEFCQINYGVSFPMFAKVDVNGADTDPIFAYLKDEAPGLLGSKTIKWNFTKFLVDKQGKVVKRYAPKDNPESAINDIEALLNQ